MHYQQFITVKKKKMVYKNRMQYLQEAVDCIQTQWCHLLQVLRKSWI